MSIISNTIPNLVNGVSQQPYALRLASQAEAQENGYSSVVEGMRKRPPSIHVAKIFNTPLSNAFVHMINRDPQERYTVVAHNGDLKVFRLTGEEITVAFPNGKGYLSAAAPSEDFEAVTVADYTFFLNKTVVTAAASNLTPTRPFETMIWIRQGAYSANYNVSVGGVSGNFTTTNANDASSGALIKTDYIAGQIIANLSSGGITAGNGYTMYQVGSSIYISRATDFTVTVSDSVGDTAIRLVKGSVQRFSDLPARAVSGFRVQVTGTNDNAFDNYFVEYEANANNPHGGVWKECPAGGEQFRINGATMPHVLIREANGTFTFRQEVWNDRTAGDLSAIPFPSFVGRTINDVFFHRNRLGFLADENIILSRAGRFQNFFPASALQQLDTDPIDIAVSHVKVSILRHAVPFNESLLLFSEQTQFSLGKADMLTPQTASVNQTTEYECSLRAKPVGAGRNVYFAVQRGQFTGISEYYVDGDSQAVDAANVTAHAPKYVPKGVIKLAASSNEDVMVALSEEEANALYVYRWYYNGPEKLQSAWQRWTFTSGSTILNCEFIESDLWLVISRPDGVFIEYVPIEPGKVDEGSEMLVHLDRRVSQSNVTNLTFTPDSSGGVTTFKLPYLVPAGATPQVVAWFGNPKYKAGQVIPHTTIEGDPGDVTFSVKGELTHFFVGIKYELRYRLSTLIVREAAQGGGGFQPVGMGRLQLRRMSLTFSNTGYFRVEVTPQYRETYSYTFSGRVVGSGQNILGSIALETSTFNFPIQAKNDKVTIEIVNDTFLPCAFLSAEWEGFFVIRSRRQ
jgi:hypothetical protein